MGDKKKTLPLRCALVTAEDASYAGERPDDLTPAVRALLEESPLRVTKTVLLPLDRAMLSTRLLQLCREGECQVILVVGGTGPALTHCTPEATLDVAERALPGIPELMRRSLQEVFPDAILDRSVAGICRGVLMVDLPGAPEKLAVCLPPLLPLLCRAAETL